MLTCLVPILFTLYIQNVLNLKKNNSGAKGLWITSETQIPVVLVEWNFILKEETVVYVFWDEVALTGGRHASLTIIGTGDVNQHWNVNKRPSFWHDTIILQCLHQNCEQKVLQYDISSIMQCFNSDSHRVHSGYYFYKRITIGNECIRGYSSPRWPVLKHASDTEDSLLGTARGRSISGQEI